MRFLTSLFMVSALVLVVVISGFLLVREYFLYQGVQDFKHTVVDLNKQGRNAITECSDRNESVAFGSDGETILQLRFTSDNEYILEVICREFSFDPVEISTHQLSPYVTKKPGTSGIVLNQGRSAVELVVFENIVSEIEGVVGYDLTFLKKDKIVGVENSYVTETLIGDDLGVGPVTSCEGYGFECCDSVSQFGIGEMREGVKGCETSCYQACGARPVVLSFTTNPFFDVATRQVHIQPGEIIDFNYVVDPGATTIVFVQLDFGDGKTEDLTTETGSSSHAYNCSVNSCSYTASVMAVDNLDESSVPTSVSQIQIVVGDVAPEAELIID